MAEPSEPPYEPLFTAADRSSQQNVYVHTSDFARNSIQSNKADAKEVALSKQTSLLHQSSSYFKQATSGLMRWQSRRAFWSAVDTPGQEPANGIACDARSTLVYWLKTVVEVARRHPSVVVAPLLLLVACIAGGVAGVVIAAQHAEQHARDNTATVARQAASMLELVLDTQMLQPAASLASLVRQQPSMAVLSLAVPPLLPRLLPGRQTTTEAEAPTTAAQVLRQVLLAPFGTVNASYSLLTSPVDSSASSGSSSGLFSVGSSLLDQRGAEGTVAAAAAAVALAVQEQLPVVATTITIATTTANGRSEVLVAVYHPVYVTGVTAGETWGNALSNDVLNRICGSGACYDSRSETKLWGFVVALGSLNALANSPDTGLQGLSDKNYQYRLTVLPSGSGGSQGVDIAASAPPPRARQGTAAVPVRLAGPRSGSAAAVAETGAELLVDHDDAWQTAWEGPLIAATVVASLVLSAFFFSMLFNYWRHMAMLQAMLPEKVIRVLGTGSNYYQHFDCVTVLYADVVRYTTAKPQQGDSVPTLEVVKLLNDVHAMYESIIEKYGLVRIRRSGESFLCVGGCPTPDEPVTVATRVAACARDLVLATSRFRGVGGFRVQIRVGLHSGPAAAAVVGSKMPRFSLFGDVVDVAYFMEATSRAMAIHVSDRTSELLTKANDPLLQLSPRGRLDIIGQGSMFTTWLRLEALPEPAPEPEAAETADARPQDPSGRGSRQPQQQQQQPQQQQQRGAGSRGGSSGGGGGGRGGSGGGGAAAAAVVAGKDGG